MSAEVTPIIREATVTILLMEEEREKVEEVAARDWSWRLGRSGAKVHQMSIGLCHLGSSLAHLC